MPSIFKFYEDVPVIIAEPVLRKSQQIFAQNCSVQIEQQVQAKKYAGDYNLPLCPEIYDSNDFTGLRFTKGEGKRVLLGSLVEGSPGAGDGLKVGVPIPPSIESIASGTIISFPSDKEPSLFGVSSYHSGNLLYVSGDFQPGDYYIGVYSEKDFNITGADCARGEMEVKHTYAAVGPVKGTLDVSFYLNTGSLQSFFNVTGLWGPYQYPPTNEERVEIRVGDYLFQNAYLKQFGFTVEPNTPSQASVSFDLFGSGVYASGYSESYFAPGGAGGGVETDYNEQLTLPHGTTSQVDAKGVGIRYPVSFSYEATVERTPDFEIPPSGVTDPGGELPARVSKGPTRMVCTIKGEKLDPHLSINGARAKITIQLKDMGYSDFLDNNTELMQTFVVDGVVGQQQLEVGDQGYLGGIVTVKEEYR